MKILHVFLFFSLKQGGGSVDLIYKLAYAQKQRGHDVTIYTGDYKLDKEYVSSLEDVEVLPFKSWFNSGFYLMPGMIREVKKKLKDFDIVHLHCYRSFQNIVIHHFAKKYGIPYVLDPHGSLPLFFRKRQIKKLFDLTYGYRILKDASRVIAETEVGADEYRKFGVEKERIVILSPPFDTEEFSQLPPPERFRSKFSIKEKHIIMFLGRINWIKGLDFLVEGFKEVSRQRSDVILVIVGPDDGYRQRLEKLINSLGLSERVLFTGFVSKKDKLSGLVDADVVVQTSRYEEGAWAPFEAVLCGTPIIVSSHTGAGEDVKKIDAGYLVEFGNKEDLCDKIQYVLNNPDIAKQKAKRAKEFIENNMSMSKRIIEYEELYKTCIEEKKKCKLRM